MRTVLTSFSLLLLTLLLSGCLEVEQHYTLNPDGSGKVAIEANIVEWGLDEADENLQQDLRERIRKYLDEAQGVDAWNKVNYSFSDGKIHFRGTAYFPDIRQLKSNDLSLGNISMTTEGGNNVVTMDLETEANVSTSSTTTKDGVETEEPMTDEEMEHQIDSLKENWGMMKGMMSMVLKEMVIKTALKLPGTPTETTGFERQGGEFVYEFHGDKMLEAMDTMMTNTEFLRQQAVRKSNDMPDEIKSVLFPDGVPHVVFPATAKPQFDYQKEMTTARKDQAKLMQELNGKATSKSKKKRE